MNRSSVKVNNNSIHSKDYNIGVDNKYANFIDTLHNKGLLGKFIGDFLVWFLDSVQVIIIALVFFSFLYIFVFSVHTVEGPSMEPTFCSGDIIIVDKFTPIFNGYSRGDVIVFKKNNADDYIKRIIAIGGDEIMFKDGDVYINGKILNEEYLHKDIKTLLFPGSRIKENEVFKVPDGHYFVMGDNRDKSSDSRIFLDINPDENLIRGKVSAIVWPINNFRIFDKNSLRNLNACI